MVVVKTMTIEKATKYFDKVVERKLNSLKKLGNPNSKIYIMNKTIEMIKGTNFIL